MSFQFGSWFTDERPAWEAEFDELTERDFQQLKIEKEKLREILNTLYQWKVIR